ncbi:MAG: hypothetical protein JSW27_19570 [Phycisphaerales bacterium]|nr:MAG: hypothetical protein JSW27_19570 [Phycisphaerales bacterium]
MIQASLSGHQTMPEVVQKLRTLAVSSLARMYLPEKRLFAFRLRKKGRDGVLEGVSRRYTATALIGLAGEDRDVVTEVLGDHSLEDVCTGLLEHIEETDDMGEVALTTWAARAIRHARASEAAKALRMREPGKRPYCTVELAWALTALVLDGSDPSDLAQAEITAQALLSAFKEESEIFRRWPAGQVVPKLPAFVSSLGDRLPGLRTHVSCFADFVYPVQALSYYYRATGDTRAANAASRCARRMCQLQGQDGQWWWHFDIRTGHVIERYPVYSVHQDSMAPMALFAVGQACGEDYSDSIEKGLRWLVNPPEKAGSLIDAENEVIWRKVARRGPGKLVRGLQATASSLHSRLRAPGVDVLFPPVSVDYETRPYHMGWILHAWSAQGDS